ncbi:MAG TPA: S1-like domain-containing RNA-binding protein [Polyangiales bacterium]
MTATLRQADARGAVIELAPGRKASAGAPARSLRLPQAELPEGAAEGDVFAVFVYLDSEDLPVVTTRVPKLQLGEVAFLTVADVNRVGAFCDWGLPKDLLVPFAEQTRELACSDREPIGLQVDNSGRLVGTMRIRELLHVGGNFQQGEWVQGEAWRNEPDVGLFVILERLFLGLLPAHEPHPLRRGDSASFRVTQVFADGKLELSLRGLRHEEIDSDAQKLLRKLSARGAAKVSDHSSPEQIRVLFGLSKKAFKRAAGRLLKEGAVTLDEQGYIVPR